VSNPTAIDFDRHCMLEIAEDAGLTIPDSPDWALVEQQVGALERLTRSQAHAVAQLLNSGRFTAKFETAGQMRARQSVVPAWMRGHADDREVVTVTRVTPFGRFVEAILPAELPTLDDEAMPPSMVVTSPPRPRKRGGYHGSDFNQ
jgi:hypothetical protein